MEENKSRSSGLGLNCSNTLYFSTTFMNKCPQTTPQCRQASVTSRRWSFCTYRPSGNPISWLKPFIDSSARCDRTARQEDKYFPSRRLPQRCPETPHLKQMYLPHFFFHTKLRVSSKWQGMMGNGIRPFYPFLAADSTPLTSPLCLSPFPSFLNPQTKCLIIAPLKFSCQLSEVKAHCHRWLFMAPKPVSYFFPLVQEVSSVAPVITCDRFAVSRKMISRTRDCENPDTTHLSPSLVIHHWLEDNLPMEETFLKAVIVCCS